jgi:nitroimidazol reductase NimA-like FMN-containing flavoprotein (pyridoxamine 5'-phosphate oxidase superfamily)
MAADPLGVTALGTSACWTLLRTVDVGRLAVCVDGLPDIFPVNFVVDHGTVVFRTAAGTKLAAALANPDVAFEVDGYYADTDEAWSVVVKGRAEKISDLQELLDTTTFPLSPWHAAPKPQFVRIEPGEVSGRRFPVVDPAAWRTVLTDAPHSSPD